MRGSCCAEGSPLFYKIAVELGPQEPRQHKCSLRSKRFQSSYCAKVSFFGSCPSFLDEPREETLATQASTNVKGFK